MLGYVVLLGVIVCAIALVVCALANPDAPYQDDPSDTVGGEDVRSVGGAGSGRVDVGLAPKTPWTAIVPAQADRSWTDAIARLHPDLSLRLCPVHQESVAEIARVMSQRGIVVPGGVVSLQPGFDDLVSGTTLGAFEDGLHSILERIDRAGAVAIVATVSNASLLDHPALQGLSRGDLRHVVEGWNATIRTAAHRYGAVLAVIDRPIPAFSAIDDGTAAEDPRRPDSTSYVTVGGFARAVLIAKRRAHTLRHPALRRTQVSHSRIP